MSKKILIAKIISARGIKGEVKIMYFGDDVKNLEKYQIFDAKNQQFIIIDQNLWHQRSAIIFVRH